MSLNLNLYLNVAACVDTFEIFEEVLSYNGDLQDVTGLDDCTQACLADPDCLAFDYEDLRQLCFIHYDG